MAYLLWCQDIYVRSQATSLGVSPFLHAQVMKLVLAAAKVDWINVDCDYAKMKKDLEAFPFGQSPRCVNHSLHFGIRDTKHLTQRKALYA